MDQVIIQISWWGVLYFLLAAVGAAVVVRGIAELAWWAINWRGVKEFSAVYSGKAVDGKEMMIQTTVSFRRPFLKRFPADLSEINQVLVEIAKRDMDENNSSILVRVDEVSPKDFQRLFVFAKNHGVKLHSVEYLPLIET